MNDARDSKSDEVVRARVGGPLGAETLNFDSNHQAEQRHRVDNEKNSNATVP